MYWLKREKKKSNKLLCRLESQVQWPRQKNVLEMPLEATTCSWIPIGGQVNFSKSPRRSPNFKGTIVNNPKIMSQLSYRVSITRPTSYNDDPRKMVRSKHKLPQLSLAVLLLLFCSLVSSEIIFEERFEGICFQILHLVLLFLGKFLLQVCVYFEMGLIWNWMWCSFELCLVYFQSFLGGFFFFFLLMFLGFKKKKVSCCIWQFVFWIQA